MTVVDQEFQNDVPLKSRQGFLERITFEHALYGLIVLAAIVLRLFDLNIAPLSPSEAHEALNMWAFWQNQSLAEIGSPAYFSLTGFLTQIMGWSDMVIRLVPVVFGVGLVILPWFVRHRTGRIGSLVTSLLLAVSPTMVILSRTGSGQSIALFAGLLLFISWLRYQESGNDRWFLVLGITFVIGLLSDALFYGTAITAVVAWIVQRTMGPALITNHEGQRNTVIWPSKQTLRTTFLLGLGVFIVLGTTILLRPDGIGAMANIAADWLQPFGSNFDLAAWTSPFLAIFRYELMLFIFGLVAAFWAMRLDQPYPLLLVYWVLASLIMVLAQRGELANIAIFVLSCSLLVGTFVDSIIDNRLHRNEIAFSLVLLLATGIIYINLSRYGRLISTTFASLGTYNLLLILAALIIIVILFILLWSWGKDTAKKSLTIGFLLILVLFGWSTSWWLTRSGFGDTRERWYTEATDGDLLLMARTIRELSWQINNSENTSDILSTIDHPSLRWYLRDFENLVVADALPPSAKNQMIITGAGQEPLLESSFIGIDFGYQRPNTDHRISWAETLRWWLFHESPVSLNEEKAILWIRSDLVNAGETHE